VRCVCWCWKSCDHQGATETTLRRKKKKQCKLKKEPRRDEKFCLAGFCAKKEQNEMKDLFYFRYDIYTFVIAARISFTCSLTFPQFTFQVRQVHVLYHSSCFRYDTHTYVITAPTTSTTCTLVFSQLAFRVRHIHCVIISCIRKIYTYVTIACSSCAVCTRTCKLPEIHLVSDASRFQTRR